MNSRERLYFLDNLRTFLIFLVVLHHAGVVYESSGLTASFWIVDDPSTSNLPGILKYPVLTITTYAACNLIAYAYAKTVKNLAATPG